LGTLEFLLPELLEIPDLLRHTFVVCIRRIDGSDELGRIRPDLGRRQQGKKKEKKNQPSVSGTHSLFLHVRLLVLKNWVSTDHKVIVAEIITRTGLWQAFSPLW
jgi:hypothetical protein